MNGEHLVHRPLVFGTQAPFSVRNSRYCTRSGSAITVQVTDGTAGIPAELQVCSADRRRRIHRLAVDDVDLVRNDQPAAMPVETRYRRPADQAE